jgi:hypothetical protein
MSSGIGLPVIFPPSGSTSRRLPFLRRVPRVGSPPSQVVLRRYDSLTPFPPHFVFLRLAVPWTAPSIRSGEWRGQPRSQARTFLAEPS